MLTKNCSQHFEKYWWKNIDNNWKIKKSKRVSIWTWIM
jgi:hypothetical protein